MQTRVRGEEAGGKPGGRIKSPLMFSGGGRKEGGRGGEGDGSCLADKLNSFSVWESVHTILLSFPFFSSSIQIGGIETFQLHIRMSRY